MQLNVQMRVSLIAGIVLLAGVFGPSAKADVTVTQLANEGVILSDGGSARVMIDGLVVDSYSVYGGLPGEFTGLFNTASGPFSGIQLALASHQHHDHNQPKYACQFIQTSKQTLFASSSQVLALMRERCRQHVTTSKQVRTLDPKYDQPEVLQVGDIKVTAFLLSHGKGKYASLQNFGHLVEIGGLRVLHLGDAAMDPADFSRAGIDKMDIDIALIPFWYFQPGPGGEMVNSFLNARHKIAVHIPPGEMLEVKEYLQKDFPQVLILEKAMDQAQFSVSAPPPP